MKLEDRIEILEVLSNLAYKHDSLDFEGYKNLYTGDVTRSIRFQNGEPRVTKGREKGIEGTFNRLKMLSERGIIDKHYYLTPILTQVSDVLVDGKVSILIANQHRDEAHPRWSATGNADLVFRKTSDGWKIAEFHVHLDRPDPLGNP
jgi:ketosteroid isomerase-like protein